MGFSLGTNRINGQRHAQLLLLCPKYASFVRLSSGIQSIYQDLKGVNHTVKVTDYDFEQIAFSSGSTTSKMPSPKAPSPPPSAPDLDILGDQITIHPSGYVDPESSQDANPEQNLVEHMARFRESPLDFLREVSLHVSGTGWRAYDDPIGQPIYYAGFTENMRAMVMRTPMLMRRIEELAAKRVEVEEKQGLLGEGDERIRRATQRRKEIKMSLQKVATDLTDRMIFKPESKRFIRGAYYLCTQLLTRAYHQGMSLVFFRGLADCTEITGIHVSSEEVLRLRSVAEQAEKKKHSIIFLPCHRSHVDYISMQLICFRLGIALPTVVAGDNLNLPVVGSFLQHAGAMWIRRSFGNDALYTTLVQSYIDTLLHNGFNMECFIEGGRSRTGKLLSPKFGILSFILDSVLSGRVDDAIICPVSTQYDKVIETEYSFPFSKLVSKPTNSVADHTSVNYLVNRNQKRLSRISFLPLRCFHYGWGASMFVFMSHGV